MFPWKKSKRSIYPPSTLGPTSDPNLANAQSCPDLRPEQPSGEQQPQQPRLSTPNRSRRSRVLDRLTWRSLFPSPSPSPSVERHDDIKSDTPIATSTPQSLALPAILAVRPHSSHAASSTLINHGLSPHTAGDNVTAASSGNCGSLSYTSSMIFYTNYYSKNCKPIASGIFAPPPACAPIPIPTSTCHIQAVAKNGVQQHYLK